jgi:hypothetical protein
VRQPAYYLREGKPDSNRGSLNSTTSVELVASPAAGFVRRSRVWIQNLDDADVIVRLRVTVAGPAHTQWYSETLTLDDPATTPGGHVAVECPDLQNGESITAVLDGAVSANQPHWVSDWVDIPAEA